MKVVDSVNDHEVNSFCFLVSLLKSDSQQEQVKILRHDTPKKHPGERQLFVYFILGVFAIMIIAALPALTLYPEELKHGTNVSGFVRALREQYYHPISRLPTQDKSKLGLDCSVARGKVHAHTQMRPFSHGGKKGTFISNTSIHLSSHSSSSCHPVSRPPVPAFVAPGTKYVIYPAYSSPIRAHSIISLCPTAPAAPLT